MMQEERTISLISYYVLLIVSRKYFLDCFVVLLITLAVDVSLHYFIIGFIDTTELSGY